MRRSLWMALFFVAALLCRYGEWEGVALAAGSALAVALVPGRGSGEMLARMAWGLAGSAAGLAAVALAAPAPRQENLPPAPLAGRVMRVVSFVSGEAGRQRCVLEDDSQPGARCLALFLTGPVRLLPGDRLLARGTRRALEPTRNPDEFDYPEYLRARRVTARCFVQTAVPLAPAGTDLFAEALRPVGRLRLAIHMAIQDSLRSAEARGITEALVLGDQAAIPDSLRSAYAATGTSHILSVSGLHLACTSAFVYLLVAAALLPLSLPGGRSRQVCALASLLFATFYLLLTGMPVSCVRSWIMLAGFALSRLANRDYDLWSGLSHSTLAILAFRPETLFEAGFQLSTISVAGIALVAVRLSSLPLSVSLKRQVGRHAPCLAPALSYLGLAAATSTAASLATLPFVWYHFGTIPLLSIPANLVVVPVGSGLVLPPALVWAFLARHVPFLGSLLATLIEHVLLFMDAVIEVLAAAAPPLAPAWPGTALAAALTASCLAAALLPGWRLRSLMAAAAVLLACAAAVPPRNARFQVHFFHVGEGDAALIQLPCGQNIMVDGGRKGSGSRVLLPYLRRHRSTTIHQLFISHGHDDHWAGLAEVISTLSVREIIHNGSPESRNAVSGLIVNGEKDPLTSERLGHAGLDQTICGTRFALVWPDPGSVDREENDRSLVLAVFHARTLLIFPGDVQTPAAMAVVARLAALASRARHEGKAVVLKAPHHGHQGGVWHALLRTLEPDLAVVPSEGDDVSLPEDWGRSGAPRIRLQVTGLDGAVTVTEEVGAEFFHGRVILE